MSLGGLVACASSSDIQNRSASRPLSRPDQGLRFAWPVLKGQITRGFLAGSSRHQGLDISGARNSPIFSAEAGRVIYTGQDFNGYGKLIIIEHDGDRWASFYAHLNQFLVREGQWVQRGEKIALMGKTGRATGVHLHFEIRHHLRPIDPLPHLSSNQRLLSQSNL